MQYISVKEYATRVGVSERAVQKQIAKGMHQVKEVPHPSRKDQVAFLVYVGAKSGEPTGELSGEPTGELSGEPTGELSGEPIAEPIAELTPPQPFDKIEQLPAAKTPTVRPKKTRKISKSAKTLASQKALFCDDILKIEITENVPRRDAIATVLELYRSGMVHQGLFAAKGEISERTTYNWLKAYEGKDYAALIEQYSPRRGHTVLADDLNFITGFMMDSADNKLGGAIRLLHFWHRRNGTAQGCSDRTLRRAFEAWKEENSTIYTMNRHGEKYVKENLLPHIEQDWSLVRGGELWFSDGCRLNFPVLNPYTGKPERPMLISWIDAATRFVCGFDIDFTENQRVVSSSFYNALVYSGYCPRYVKLDNGLAFRAHAVSGKLSKIQREQLDEADAIERNMLQGAFYRCGVERVSFGKPYNSTSKAIIERWHGTLNTGLQSFLPNYSGNSVANKPARMHRNEKFLQELEHKGYLTLLEAKLLIEGWILEIYGMEPHRGLGGKTPVQAWQESLAAIPAEQKKSAAEFYWLMLTSEVKKLGSQGVKVRGINYWAEPLINYVGQPVSVRYSQMDDRFVYIFRSDGDLICRAEALNPLDPLASLRPEKGLEAMELTNRMRERNRILKRIKRDTAEHHRLTAQKDDTIQSLVQSQQARLTVLHPDALPQPQLPDADPIEEDEAKAVTDAIGDTFKKLGITN